jgi:NhaP-type Na+/H+ and K+/H+ antiporter
MTPLDATEALGAVTDAAAAAHAAAKPPPWLLSGMAACVGLATASTGLSGWAFRSAILATLAGALTLLVLHTRSRRARLSPRQAMAGPRAAVAMAVLLAFTTAAVWGLSAWSERASLPWWVYVGAGAVVAAAAWAAATWSWRHWTGLKVR